MDSGVVPTLLAQEAGVVLGAQAGEKKLREVITAGGVRHVRRAIETPFNMILEARPRIAEPALRGYFFGQRDAADLVSLQRRQHVAGKAADLLDEHLVR